MDSACTLRILAGVALAALLATSTSAQIMFLADFEDGSADAVPSAKVNDVAHWDILAPGQTLALADHPTNGTQALKITVEGCGNSSGTASSRSR